MLIKNNNTKITLAVSIFCNILRFSVPDLPTSGCANTSTCGINARSKSLLLHSMPSSPNDEAAFINNDSPSSSEWF